MTISKKLMTAEELFCLPDDGWRYELVKGKLIKMPPGGGEHGGSSITVGSRLATYAESTGTWAAVGAETGFRLARDPDTVRAPDAALIRKDRLPGGRLPAGYIEMAPDLAVEVVSPGDRPNEIAEKVREWLDAGTGQVWVLYRRTRSVVRHEAGSEPVSFLEDDILTAGSLLPGFSCRVRDLFP